MSNVYTHPIHIDLSRVNATREPSRAALNLPLCFMLLRRDVAPKDAAGVVLIRKSTEIRPGRTMMTASVHGLPEPTVYGDFDSYEAVAFIPEVITWRWPLDESAEPIPTWSGTFTEITLELTKSLHVHVRPVNLATNETGVVILGGYVEPATH